MDYITLAGMARKAVSSAYSPYSGIKVGAALLTDDGLVYTGCNIENASFGASICAERTALVKAVSDGKRAFKAIAISSSLGRETYPCGICRQMLSEFSPEMDVILTDNRGGIWQYKLSDLIPNVFCIDEGAFQ